MTEARAALHELAERRGIVPGYWDVTGREFRETSDETRVLLLAAMGVDASTEAAACAALGADEAAERARVVEPVWVWRESAQGPPWLRVRVPLRGDGEGPFDPTEPLTWRLELDLEGGDTVAREGPLIRSSASPISAVALPFSPLPGHHRIRFTLSGRGGERTGVQRFIVAPRTALRFEERLGGRRIFGLWANLYSVRGGRGFGVGDLGDLRALLGFCRDAGGDFVGVNPLHALRNRGSGISPYSPVSRLFRNPLYLDVASVPEMEDCDEARKLLGSAPLRRELGRLRAAPSVDYEGAWSAKRKVLAALHRAFARRAAEGGERAAAYGRFRAERGRALDDFATFMAIEEHRRAAGERETSWREWPAPLRDPRGDAVTRFRDEHAEAVDFERWLQFELDRQLAALSSGARQDGLALGVYQDLAVGSAPDSSDTWAFPDLFARGANAGAPPDDYAANGQDWGLPPLDPRALRESGHDYWIRLLRAGFAHAGALRIDHVIGLFRLFWIPQGRSGREGAYVRYPTHEMLGILALESRRANALVVGEDLGTVPAEVPGELASWGVLSSRLLYFERDGAGFRGSASYSPRALVAASTHDLAPLAGWWESRDVALRREVGQLASDAEAEGARSARAGDREALCRRLEAEGLLPAGSAAAAGDPGRVSLPALGAAVNAFLCRTPAPLVALSLDDLAGEREPVNLPGVSVEQHPSWSRKMETPLEEIPARAAEALAGARGRGARAPARR